MKRRLFTAGATMIAGLGLFLAATAETAQAQFESYLVVDSVSVRTTRPDGRAWDPFGGAPDIVVRVQNLSGTGIQYATPAIRNSFGGTVYANGRRGYKTFDVRAGDQIRISVWDEDFDADDYVGGGTYTVTAADMRRGQIVFGSFGNVNRLVLNID